MEERLRDALVYVYDNSPMEAELGNKFDEELIHNLFDEELVFKTPDGHLAATTEGAKIIHTPKQENAIGRSLEEVQDVIPRREMPDNSNAEDDNMVGGIKVAPSRKGIPYARGATPESMPRLHTEAGAHGETIGGKIPHVNISAVREKYPAEVEEPLIESEMARLKAIGDGTSGDTQITPAPADKATVSAPLKQPKPMIHVDVPSLRSMESNVGSIEAPLREDVAGKWKGVETGGIDSSQGEKIKKPKDYQASFRLLAKSLDELIKIFEGGEEEG